MTSPLPSLKFVVLDTETTGFVPKVHRVIEIAYIVMDNGKIEEEFDSLISVPATIPPHVQVLTRIRQEDLLKQPTFEKLLPRLQSVIDDTTIIVGQNIQFDLRMLKGEGYDITHLPWIDTAMLASMVFPELASYSLGYVSAALKLHHEPKHRALGDTRATLELLQHCCERLQSLPKKELAALQDLARRAPEGYRRLFSSLSSVSTRSPAWLHTKKKRLTSSVGTTCPDAPGSLTLQDDVLSRGLGQDSLHTGVTAVRNLDAFLSRFPLTENRHVIFAAENLLDPDHAKTLLNKSTFTADEFTLSAKLLLYKAHTKRDVPLHGEEYAIWDGCLRATHEHPLYRSQFMQGDTLIDQRELLRVLNTDPTLIPAGTPVHIEDAAILEDAATSALEQKCVISQLRAASSGDVRLTRIVDAIELWAQRLRGVSDVRILAPSDFTQQSTLNLLTTVQDVFQTSTANMRRLFGHLLFILDPTSLSHSIVWIDANQDGAVTLHAVPRDIASLLEHCLYTRHPTTVVVPPGDISLCAILPLGLTTVRTTSVAEPQQTIFEALTGATIDDFILNTKGSTVILASSKRIIEDIYIRLSETCEQHGIQLACQGFGGGQSRIQAEFALAPMPKVLVTTPWAYETFELPCDSVDTLVLQSLPFDHPSHPVISERVKQYASPFEEYSLPRMLLRVFRLLKTFLRHATSESRFILLDARITGKPYGKIVFNYLAKLLPKSAVPVQETLL